MTATTVSLLKGPPEDGRLYDQERRAGYAWLVEVEFRPASPESDVDAETVLEDVCQTQGDAIWTAWFHAVRLSEGHWNLPMHPIGAGGRWQGSDGETSCTVKVRPVEEIGRASCRERV